MSLMELVMDLIEQRPGCNVDEILSDLPGYSRRQVMQAMQNLAFKGRARCERQGVKGQHKGAKPGRYYKVKPVLASVWRGQVSSVWQLGSRA